jgi:hypothetical protein
VPSYRTSPPRTRSALPPAIRARLLRYARAALHGIRPSSREAWALMRWLANHAGPLGLAMPPALVAEWADPLDPTPPGATAWRAMRGLLDTQPALNRAQRPFAALAEALGLDRTEEAILTLAADYRACAAVELLCDEIATHRGGRAALGADAGLFALLLHVTQAELAARLRAEAPLRATGVLRLDEDGEISLLPRLLRLAADPAPPGDLRAALLGTEAKTTLPFEAFAHLGAESRADRTRHRRACAALRPARHRQDRLRRHAGRGLRRAAARSRSPERGSGGAGRRRTPRGIATGAAAGRRRAARAAAAG